MVMANKTKKDNIVSFPVLHKETYVNKNSINQKSTEFKNKHNIALLEKIKVRYLFYAI